MVWEVDGYIGSTLVGMVGGWGRSRHGKWVRERGMVTGVLSRAEESAGRGSPVHLDHVVKDGGAFSIRPIYIVENYKVVATRKWSIWRELLATSQPSMAGRTGGEDGPPWLAPLQDPDNKGCRTCIIV